MFQETASHNDNNKKPKNKLKKIIKEQQVQALSQQDLVWTGFWKQSAQSPKQSATLANLTSGIQLLWRQEKKFPSKNTKQHQQFIKNI